MKRFQLSFVNLLLIKNLLELMVNCLQINANMIHPGSSTIVFDNTT